MPCHNYFIYTDLITSLLDPKLVDPGSTLIYVDAYKALNLISCSKDLKLQFVDLLYLLNKIFKMS